MTEAIAPPGASFLASRKGQLTLAFLCLVAFLDFMGFAIMTVALPTIQRDLHFSQQNLQWVISGYTVTYGGFLLLGGRLADLLGRRVTLVIGTAVFAVTSVLGGAAPNAGTLVGARLAQGIGAALMTPAALSILTTSFNVGTDRVKALGAWGAMGVPRHLCWLSRAMIPMRAPARSRRVPRRRFTQKVPTGKTTPWRRSQRFA